ncbi:hypothetical protein K490DRAFT_64353 [Saccharata proteae CBS 121410]|uniref:Uncharacterized protein n=1 Tax=Saccharata proteae CBS 121410 TaxID=1314787 RepID=A0A6A5YCS2_9PEZI|nr:hypothetical protein K490DRAFT_64353 [Saccharata proteae CBS 121410]
MSSPQPPPEQQEPRMARPNPERGEASLSALAPELVEMIDEQLVGPPLGPHQLAQILCPDLRLPQSADAISLRAVSRGLRVILGSQPNRNVTQDQRKEFVRRMNLDVFRRFCDKERRGLLPDGGLVCSGCEEAHPSSQFSHKQTFEKPEERICKGLQYPIRLCPHRSVYYDELRPRGQPTWFRRPQTLLAKRHWECDKCIRCDPEEPYKLLPFRYIISEVDPTDDTASTTEYDSVRYILNLRNKAMVSQEDVNHALHAACVQICPHVNTSDPNVFDVEYTIKNLGIGWEIRANGLAGKQKPFTSCKAPWCGTRFRLFIFTNSLYLHSRREIGDMTSPTNLEWLAQVYTYAMEQSPETFQDGVYAVHGTEGSVSQKAWEEMSDEEDDISLGDDFSTVQ